MDRKLEKTLQNKYPDILKNMYGDMSRTCMAFGIETPDAWYNLLDNLLGDLTRIQKQYDVEITAQQIKEKFGTLRFYHDTKLGKSWTFKKRHFNIFIRNVIYKLINLPFIPENKLQSKLLVFSTGLETTRHLFKGKENISKCRYWDGGEKVNANKLVDECISNAINKYENFSYMICADCATSGTHNNPIIETSGWISYICKDCNKIREREYKKARRKFEKRIERKSFTDAKVSETNPQPAPEVSATEPVETKESNEQAN